MAVDAGLNRDRERITTLLYRVRPGDEILVETNQMWNAANNGPREMLIWKVVIEAPPGYDDDFYRVYGKGPRQRNDDELGSYVLMPSKPREKGNNPEPEVFHRTPNPDAKYKETTKGAIISLDITT